MSNGVCTPILIQQETRHLRRFRVIPRRRPKLKKMEHRQCSGKKRRPPERRSLEGEDDGERSGEGEESAEDEGARGDAGEGDGLGGVVLFFVCGERWRGGGDGGEGGGLSEAAMGDLGDGVSAVGGGGGGEDGDGGFTLV